MKQMSEIESALLLILTVSGEAVIAHGADRDTIVKSLKDERDEWNKMGHEFGSRIIGEFAEGLPIATPRPPIVPGRFPRLVPPQK